MIRRIRRHRDGGFHVRRLESKLSPQWAASVAAIAQLVTAAASAYSAATPPSSSSKAETGGTSTGGQKPAPAQTIFNQGQPQSQASTQPPPDLSTMWDPVVQAQLNQMLGLPNNGSTAPIILDASNKEPLALQGPGMLDPSLKPAELPKPGIGDILTSQSFGDIANALAKAAPLLGLTGGQYERRQWTGSPAGGGGGGPSPFQLPHRNTLAEILASLPRAM